MPFVSLNLFLISSLRNDFYIPDQARKLSDEKLKLMNHKRCETVELWEDRKTALLSLELSFVD